MKDHRTAIVATGYDAIADAYLAWAAEIEGDPRERMLDAFLARADDGGRVLDVGCGAGVPSTALLVERFEVTGVDISREQIARARRNVPQASFIQGDIAQIQFPPGSFEGVTAFHAISHLPRETHARLFERVAGWLVPGGLFLASLGANDSPDWIGEWLGQPMFFSSFAADVNRRLLVQAGFELLIDEVIETIEPDGPIGFLWVLARKH